MYKRNGATIRNIAEVLWETFPAHHDAHSKRLVGPDTAPATGLDYRISSYQPKGFVTPHRHKVQEQIYHVLDGEGLMEIDGERVVVRRHDYIHLPPGVEHAIYNTGLQDLVFLVITTPPTDD
ncbi:MAG: cupin domain-containing protein [Rhodospirillales bacterium]|nr:cupin domain-containing protein [Rhodospirillales bacterium]MDE2198007.1 cupin domain-containing protein [Rhodospirillales bacterium]MDE2574569.1 cupin domain-containing protein [Rhodospirillales bacterium]